jgi:hypothetical protein
MSTLDSGGSQQDEAGVRLQRVTTELRELEQIIRTGHIDPRVLQEFRESVDHVRTTAWAIQQWIALRDGRKDPYSVLPMLTLERVKRAIQLAHDLSLDLDAADLSLDTPGLKGLINAIRGLHQRLSPLFKDAAT